MQEFPNSHELKIWCRKNGDVSKKEMTEACFMLLVLRSGRLEFCIEESFTGVEGPCCVCFAANEKPKLMGPIGAEYFLIGFQPEMINENMTLELVQEAIYKDVAQVHDLFLLSPFLEKKLKGPISGEGFLLLWQACENLNEELKKEGDSYWHYRCRSYFMEILIELERLADITKKMCAEEATVRYLNHKSVKDAVKFIEKGYSKKIEIKDVAASCGLNPTTLTTLMKRETGMTVMEYIQHYRIKVSKQLLISTKLTSKEIALQCGFRTAAHFCHVFKKRHGRTPEEFRKEKWENDGIL